MRQRFDKIKAAAVIRAYSFIAVALLALAACGQQPARGDAPLAGARIGGPFTLTDQNGRTISDTAFNGRYRIVYFGYTFCPDVCPTDVQAIGAAVKLVEQRNPTLGARIVPIFITVDPRRDTPAVLKQFVTAFHGRMVGLTGGEAAIERVKKQFAVFSSDQPPATPGGGYLVDHTRQAYLMDPAGRPLALLPQDKGPEAIAADIERWAR